MPVIKNLQILLLSFLSVFSAAQDQNYLLQAENFKEPITALNVSPDGTRLLAGFQDGSFSILDINTMAPLVTVEDAHYKSIYAIEMPPKMDFILTAGHNIIKLWTPDGKLIKNWKAHATTIWNVDISNDGRYAVSSEFNKTFRLWDVNSGDVLEDMRGHEDVTMTVAISPDNRYIASGSNDLTIKIWDVSTHQPVKTFYGPTREIYDVKFSPDSRILAAASNDNTIRLYDIDNEKMLHLLKGHRDFVIDIEFSPDGRYLISASADQSVYLWDVGTGEKIYGYLENEDALLDLVFHPDGRSFFSSSLDKSLKKWELDPEIFVLRYFEKEYLDEIAGNHFFDDRRKGESKKDYDSRMEVADKKRSEIIDRYYQEYLKRFD